MKMIVCQDLFGKVVLINPAMIERVHISSEAPQNARCTIELQSGKSMHVLDSFDNMRLYIDKAIA